MINKVENRLFDPGSRRPEGGMPGAVHSRPHDRRPGRPAREGQVDAALKRLPSPGSQQALDGVTGHPAVQSLSSGYDAILSLD